MEAFIWMFKNENFKKHFIMLFFTSIVLFILGLIIFSLSAFIGTVFLEYNKMFSIIIYFIGGFFLLSSFFLVIGYFWELTANIIERKTDFEFSNIYDGNKKEYSVIELPEWNVKKFVWRGFASIIATIIMYIPFFILLVVSITAGAFALNSLGSSLLAGITTMSAPVILICVLSFILMPGLLWNYAVRDSVVATLNIPKAVYLAGNHLGRYFINGIKYFLFYILDFFITKTLIILFGIENFRCNLDIAAIVLLILLGIIMFSKFLYKIFVYAYLLGTITPNDEF